MPAGHTSFSYAVTTQHMEDFVEIAGLEPVVTDGESELPDFKQQPRYNETRNPPHAGNQSSSCSTCRRF
jgi:L-arabinose isomerase